MLDTTQLHPDAVLEAIQSSSSHPTKLRNLELIHKVCNELKALGSKDYSLKTVGEAVEARGGLKVKALWNVQSADYRKLIEAWQAYAGGPKLRETAKLGAADTLTRSIADPAMRIVVEKLVRERSALLAEVNILKAQSKVVIDKRPPAVTRAMPLAPDGAMTLEASTGPALSTLEREALEHAISADLWSAESWQEEKNGRVVKLLGEGRTRTIFKPGFVSAVKTVLKSN
jgi:hypothetical protein